MISLFNIFQPVVDTSKFTNLLHDPVVTEFENEFASYVGAPYALAVNSATTAISLIAHTYLRGVTFDIPSCIPPVVPNALISAGCHVKFNDSTEWIGKDYVLHRGATFDIIDSAHRVDRNQHKEYGDGDLVIYSFYPTKPCGGADGGMIVSTDRAKIDYLRTLSYNGMSQEANNWERRQTHVGFKYYMSAMQATVAIQNLWTLDEKKEKIKSVRDRYNLAFGLENTSDHLYRIKTADNALFIDKAKKASIVCGIHYAAAHRNPIFGSRADLPKSDEIARTTASIPMHEALTDEEVETVIKFVLGNA